MKATFCIGARLRAILLPTVLALAASLPVQAAVSTAVNGNTATVSVDLAGGVAADVSIGFNDAQNLQPAALGVQVELAQLLDLSLLARLPSVASTVLAAAFPLIVTIEPPASSGLEFADTVRVEIHTHNLVYAPGTRLRLFKASLGGNFRDVTEAVEAGSVRTRGRTGGFSQFIVLLDLRTTSAVVRQKYTYLTDRLADAGTLDANQRASLEGTLAASRQASLDGDQDTAIALLDLFDTEVRQLSGSVIPNRWRAGGALDNIGGDLQAGAATLRFSLGYLRDYGD